MEDKPLPASTKKLGIIVRLTSFISRACQIPPKPRIESMRIKGRLKALNRKMRARALKIELWKSREAKFIIIISLMVGVLVGFFNPSRGFRGLLGIHQDDFVLPKDVIVSAQSLKTNTGYSSSFPPPTFVFESLEFEIDVWDVSGGVLHVNFTKDGQVIHTETVFPWDPKKIVLVHDGHRLGYSDSDVVLWAEDDDVEISHLMIQIGRRDRVYYPLWGALQFVAVAYFIVVPIVEKVKNRGFLRNSSKRGYLAILK